MFRIAWAVVESENRSSWGWFITILQETMGLDDGTGWTVISDQQKGLVDSLCEILPMAEHRKCARHVSANWKIKHKSVIGRKAFWNTVYACNKPDHLFHLNELKRIEDSGEDLNAYSDFVKNDVATFCRAFVSRGPKCDSIESNICETWNGCIVKWRALKIINLLEGIRTYVMSRLVQKVILFQTTTERLLCPRIAQKIEKGKLFSRNCNITCTLDNVCECEIGDNRYVVELERRKCSCGYWELSGRLCSRTQEVQSRLRRPVTCSKCTGVGHNARSCLRRQGLDVSSLSFS
ncbi:hypothetical protein LINGRAHAP2_LOCUS36727 [Linum grandiflorum]